MKQAINPQDTTRAYAFEMWMQAPMPMVTFFRTLDVSHLLRISRRTKGDEGLSRMDFGLLNRKKIETLDGVSTFRSQSVAEK